MIQQILFLSYAYIKKRSLSLGESTTERDLFRERDSQNDAKDIDILKQSIQFRTNMDRS